MIYFLLYQQLEKLEILNVCVYVNPSSCNHRVCFLTRKSNIVSPPPPAILLVKFLSFSINSNLSIISLSFQSVCNFSQNWVRFLYKVWPCVLCMRTLMNSQTCPLIQPCPLFQNWLRLYGWGGWGFYLTASKVKGVNFFKLFYSVKSMIYKCYTHTPWFSWNLYGIFFF